MYSESAGQPYHYNLNRMPRAILGPQHGPAEGRCTCVAGTRMNSVASFFRLWGERDSHLQAFDQIRTRFKAWRFNAGDAMPSRNQMRTFLPPVRLDPLPLPYHPSGGLPPHHPALDASEPWFDRDRGKMRLQMNCVNANGLPGHLTLPRATAPEFNAALEHASVTYRPREVVDPRMFVWHLDAVACVRAFTMSLLDTSEKTLKRFFHMGVANTFLHLPGIVTILFEFSAASSPVAFSASKLDQTSLMHDILAFHRVIEAVGSRVWVRVERAGRPCDDVPPSVGQALSRQLSLQRDLNAGVQAVLADDPDFGAVADGTHVCCPGFGVYRTCSASEPAPQIVRERFVQVLQRIADHFLGIKAHEFPLDWRHDASVRLSDFGRLAALCRLPPRDFYAWSDHLAPCLCALKRIAHNAAMPCDGWISPSEPGDVLLPYPEDPSELVGLQDARWLAQLTDLAVRPSPRSLTVPQLWDPFPFRTMAVEVEVIVASPKSVASQEPARAWGDSAVRCATYHALRCIIAGLESIQAKSPLPMETLETQIFASAMGEPPFHDTSGALDQLSSPWTTMATQVCPTTTEDGSGARPSAPQARKHVPAILRAQPFGHAGLGSRAYGGQRGGQRVATARLRSGPVPDAVRAMRHELLGCPHICENRVCDDAMGSWGLFPDRPDDPQIDGDVFASKKLEPRYAVVGGVWDAHGLQVRVDMKAVPLKRMHMTEKDVEHCIAVQNGAIRNCHFGGVNSSYHGQGFRTDKKESWDQCTHNFAGRENYTKALFGQIKTALFASRSAGSGPSRCSDVLGNLTLVEKDLDAIAAAKRSRAGTSAEGIGLRGTPTVEATWQDLSASPFASAEADADADADARLHECSDDEAAIFVHPDCAVDAAAVATTAW